MRKTIQYINSHPLNKSKTKEAHSFSKSPRFQKIGEGGASRLYDLSKSAVAIRPKSPGMVFQKQTRFKQRQTAVNQRSRTPSPNQYHYPGSIQQSAKKKKGIAFPRSERKLLRADEIPGPGRYNVQKYNPEKQRIYTISRQKKMQDSRPNTPGPGQYNNFIKNRPINNTIIGKAQRFKEKLQYTPSPGQYFKNRKFIDESQVHRKSPKYTFGTSRRDSEFNVKRQLSPGPGSYNTSFSQFSERSQRIFNILKRL